MVYNTWEKKADLENTKEVVAESEGKMRISAKIRRQERLDIVEEKNFRTRKLLERSV